MYVDQRQLQPVLLKREHKLSHNSNYARNISEVKYVKYRNYTTRTKPGVTVGVVVCVRVSVFKLTKTAQIQMTAFTKMSSYDFTLMCKIS